MKINGKSLELQKGLNREWVISNGIGGFASQTILGINTRKYHGLLVAPLDPPSRRFVILSKVDESITYEDTKEEKILYSNVCKNYISDIEYDDYDKLLQLADMMNDRGKNCSLQYRCRSLAERYPVQEEFLTTHFRCAENLRRYFEAKCDCDIYQLLNIRNE